MTRLRSLCSLLALSLLLAALCGCAASSRASDSEGFALRYERWAEGAAHHTVLDAYEGMIQLDTVTALVSASWHPTDAERDELRAIVERHGLASLQGPFTSEALAEGDARAEVAPNIVHVITFTLDGELHTVRGDATGKGYERADPFFACVDELQAFMEALPECQPLLDREPAAGYV